MKKKFSRILGVAVTVALVASLFGFAIPAAAQPGNILWTAQPLPTAAYFVYDPGADVVDIAIASDGQTIYAVTGANMTAAATPWALYKSTDAGHSWANIALAGVTGAINAQVRNVAVASDNPDAIAISTYRFGGATTDRVFISNTGGASWALLPALQGANVNQVIMDLAIAPARTGTVFGREYFVAIADFRPGIALGDVQMIGAAAAWATVGAVVGAADYMAVTTGTNFLGDRCVITVGAAPAVGSVIHIINTALLAQVHARVVLNALVDDYLAAIAALGILAADIGLPSNFDPLTTAAERSYTCVASGTIANDGVYRTDFNVRWELGLAGTAWRSVAYNGTLDEGILFAGTWATPNMRYTTNMTVSAPTWIWTQKPPTGTGRTLLRVAADYATTARVFAATGAWTAALAFVAADESAFNVSNNAGKSFDQIGLIDPTGAAANVVGINGIALTPDAGTIFVATYDGTNMNLWKSATPVSPWSWSRIWWRAATAGMLRLNPLWDDAPVIFLADVAAAGAIYVSTDGGDIFATNRSAPTGVTAATIGIQDADTLYLGGTNNFIYKSTNAAFTWPYAAANPLVGVIISLQAPITDHVLVGGTNACSYSTDGGVTFTLINVGLPVATYIMIADEGYGASPDIVYAGGSNNIIYRFDIGVSSSWESLINPTAAAIVGMGMSNGALYGMSAGAADRTLNPHDAVAEIAWRTMDSPPVGAWAPAAAIANFAVADNDVYSATAVINLYAYDDYLATMQAVIKSPVDGWALAVDPNTGTGHIYKVVMEAMGTETGMVNRFLVAIWEKAVGPGGMTVLAQGANLPVPTLPSWNMAPAAPAPVAPAMGFTMQPNTEYQMMIRARNEVGGDLVNSLWSDIITISVQAGGLVTQPQAGPILLGPPTTEVDVCPGFSWAPIVGATEYEFILSLDATLTQTVEGTPVNISEAAWQVPCTTLDYDTTYFWAVKSTKPTESPQSFGTFHTITAPEVFTCPICGETFGSEAALSAHTRAVHPEEPVTPAYIWGIIGIGAILVIVVLVLIVRTRRAV